MRLSRVYEFLRFWNLDISEITFADKSSYDIRYYDFR